ncbi:MAG: aminodeoxychorismate synthase component I [Pseudomonadota bacterium]
MPLRFGLGRVRSARIKTVIVDNYDSFTYNLFHLLYAANGVAPTVVKNDAITAEGLRALQPDQIVISPGPGHPGRRADVGVCAELEAWPNVPVLGICLGQQAIYAAHGGEVGHAPQPVHGQVHDIYHDDELFAGVPSPFSAVRYHSLVCKGAPPAGLQVIAQTADGLNMAIRHRTKPMWGVQFHPESILTQHGVRLIENFNRLSGGARSKSAPHERVPPDINLRSAPAALPRQTLFVRGRTVRTDVSAEVALPALFDANERVVWLDTARRRSGQQNLSILAGSTGQCELSYDVRRNCVFETRGGVTTRHDGSIYARLNRLLPSIDVTDLGGAAGVQIGFLGYLAYEANRVLGVRARHANDYPDAQLFLPGRVAVFEPQERRVRLVTTSFDAADTEGIEWLERAVQRLDTAEASAPRSGDAAECTPTDGSAPPQAEPATIVDRGWEQPRADYLRTIDRCLDYIRDGDSYEICITNRRRYRFAGDDAALYRALRAHNPAPYAAYMRFGDLRILCSSPESFLEISSAGAVRAKPIKGTAPRSDDADEDAGRRAALANSRKDRSENLMITDLLRNDIGRVAKPGSVAVPKLMAVESYENVHHLVTTVTGQLRADATGVDCVRACFPGGSMTGAPKKRTMEIIDRLERSPRGVYSGAIGYFGLDGAVSLNIVIRTLVLHDDELTIGSGGAIVALSDPIDEFAEIELKASKLVQALDSIAETDP